MDVIVSNERFNEDVLSAIDYLKSVGCSEIYLFGSLVNGNASDSSDIDIAVRGINPDDFFYIYGQLMYRLQHRVDLVDLDLQEKFGNLLINSGELKRVA
ncbi:nucleotidyltransferase family protein [Spirochaeta dissipatitropha]